MGPHACASFISIVSKLLLIYSGRVSKLIAVKIYFNKVSEGVFTVHHAVELFTRVVFAKRHSLFPTVLYNGESTNWVLSNRKNSYT